VNEPLTGETTMTTDEMIARDEAIGREIRALRQERYEIHQALDRSGANVSLLEDNDDEVQDSIARHERALASQDD
jgi:hypothetical protein